ncbi:MAG: hypothetical protein QM640_03190 [Niabella sp.]
MKNNPNTKYILIALVVLIWGLIIYKVIKGLSGEDTPAPQTVYIPKPKQQQDTAYNLLATAYPDPFNNDLAAEEAAVDTLAAGKNMPPPAQPYSSQLNAMPAAPPPAIKYNGYIYNPVTRKKTALITYNGRTMAVGVAEKIDEKIKIIKIDDEQLTFSYNGKRISVNVGG